MAKMTEITCKCGCGRKKMVRTADVKRGWGLFYSKSCKAKHQEKNTGQCKAYLRGEGVSHAARRRGEDPGEAIMAHCERNGIECPDLSDDDYGYGHIFASGDAGHGQD